MLNENVKFYMHVLKTVTKKNKTKRFKYLITHRYKVDKIASGIPTFPPRQLSPSP